MSTQSIAAILDALYFEARTERGKGTSFERLVRQFLLTDPRYAERFDEVWMWSDWPGRDGRPDRGIDLVARERQTGELCAVQCKFYDPERSVSKKDVDTFLAESGTGEFSSRLFVSTTEHWNRAAEQTVAHQAVPVSRIGLQDLFSSTIDWDSFSLQTPEVMVRVGRKSLREHQRRALAAVTEGLRTADRGKLIMACGTGKTFTSLRIAEAMAGVGAGGGVLFLVPSIALLSQTLREWSAEAEVPLRSFAVCSDAKVGKGRSKDSLSEDISVVDLAIPATTDAHALAQRLARPAVSVDGVAPMTVVFATYQSIDVVARAQEAGAPAFDLIICDEAHRTTGATAAGEQDSAFVRVHDSAYLRGAKRLYMTATPRIYDDSTKARAGEKNAVLASMDDETTYGAELFRLGFGEAVSRSLLTDYKVLVLTVSEEQVAAQLQSSLAQDGQLKLDDAARIVGCWNALAKRSAQAGDFGADDRPMRTAVAFARDIATSTRFASSFNGVAEDYRRTLAEPDGGASGLGSVEVRHVDGSMNILERTERLSWLAGGAEEATAGDGASSCRVLTNARCLSEGVDVPALDAVMFLSPRKSQVDIVQSVGRVMRLAPGKKYGYIILPVAIPAGKAPEEVLADNDVFRVVWEVLQALRAHDERFDAMVNKIDLNRSKPDKVAIIDPFAPGGDLDGDDGASGSPTAQGLQAGFDLDSLGRWKDAIYARLVQKVGSRRYWEQWAKDVAQIAARHRTRLERRVADPAVAGEFETFLAALRANLNDSITEDSAIDMLSQHLVTKPVFDAVFDGYDFGAENPVAQVMSRMLTVLDGDSLEAETQQLEGFYASVRERCAGIDNAEGKQRVITELYEKFFSLAFPATAKSLGIVYTPVEIVDFILRSVDWLSREHFGRGVSDEGVHVLDPFTGTGTFIVRLLQSGLIRPEDLARKYASELHANEILLLAYYIATANIEVAYRDCASGSGDGYAPFNGIVLTDTFQMGEDDDVLDRSVFVANNDRAEAQRGLDIRLIVGNPPYSVGQKSANDNNANQPYPCLDLRIADTYAKRSTGTNKNSLYDAYLRAIRWASDRLGDAGVIGFVTNGGFIDANTADGVRLSLAEEFAHIYVFNLRGNQRTAGELSRQEGGKVFGAGSRATVAVTFLVKDPAHTGPAVIHYRDVGDYLSREDKLAIVADSRVEEMDWDQLVPNEVGDWVNQRDPRYGSWQPIGGKGVANGVFRMGSNGLKTNRDAWVYSYSLPQLSQRVSSMVDYYNEQARAGVEPEFLDPTRFSWNENDKKNVEQGRTYRFDVGRLYTSVYRPFVKQHVCFDRQLNNRVYRLYECFPTPAHDNLGFYLTGVSSHHDFSALLVDSVPNLHLLDTGQFFPRWTWEKIPGRHAAEGDGFDLDALSEPQGEAGSAVGYEGEVIGDYRRVDNITDATLAAYRAAYGPGVDKADVFYYVYGLLHHPEYRSRYGADLKKSLPRIPLVATREDFTALATAGRALADLHLDYEEVEPWPLTLSVDGAILPWARRTGLDPARLRVTKMRYAKTRVDGTRVDDKTSIVYNEHVTVSGIPEQAQDYLLGSRSALDWLLDRYQVKVDKASGIVNDPNDWMDEGAGAEPGASAQPLYLLDLIARVTTVSVRTQQIVGDLGPLEVLDAEV
ncbi:DEAD/DEAH box helicase [Actinomyces marmotae]|uniref:DEAD/DEAH box helicase n=1 Tax=Actinomyces marmotae TaxID=2737173 RepID=UPI001358E4EA|nr:type ISP restriction/modification enzyme [Actinomyces marmotae]